MVGWKICENCSKKDCEERNDENIDCEEFEEVEVVKFEIEISEEDLKELREKMSNVIDEKDLDDEGVISELFYLDMGMYGEVDCRGEVKVKKIE